MNGHGQPVGKVLGRVLESVSEILFMLLLILLAKGYTVTRYTFSPPPSFLLLSEKCLFAYISNFYHETGKDFYSFFFKSKVQIHLLNSCKIILNPVHLKWLLINFKVTGYIHHFVSTYAKGQRHKGKNNVAENCVRTLG